MLKSLFSKCKGHQTYPCVAVAVTPCPVVVCRYSLYLKKRAFVQAGILELHTLLQLPFPIHSWIQEQTSIGKGCYFNRYTQPSFHRQYL